jgi:general secretion pathway protein A
MYHDFFGIAENPFSITPDPRYLYMSGGHEEALAHLLYGVSEGGGFVLLTGEVGTGKTSICRCLLEQLPDTAAVALILNPRLDEIELLASICDELGVTYPEGTRSLKVLVDLLNQHLLALHAAGRHGVVIIDEAQDLSPQVLEQVRLLTNLETATRKLLQVILIGQPELNALLERPELRQVVQRITARYHLQPLGRADTQAYVQHRLAVGGLGPDLFNRRAIAAVYRRARGVPRLINSLCDRCLLGAYAQNRKAIDARLVRQAAREVFDPPPDRRRRGPAVLTWLAATAVVAGALLVLDPADQRLLPQAEAWRLALRGFVQGVLEAIPETGREQADLGRQDAEPAEGGRETPESVPAGDPAVGPTAKAQLAAKTKASLAEDGAGVAEPAALGMAANSAADKRAGPAVAESPAASGLAPIGADAGVASQATPAMPALADPEATGQAAGAAPAVTGPGSPGEAAGAMAAERDGEALREAAAGATAQAEPGPGAEVAAVVAGETAALSRFETEETAPSPRLSDPRLAPSASNSLALAEVEGKSALDANAAAQPSVIDRPAATAALKGSTFLAATYPTPKQALTIDDLFTRPSLSADRDSALATLFDLWGLDSQRLGGPAHCANSARRGVKCLAEKASWQTLIGFNRPLLITLQDRQGRRARAVLAAVDGDLATLLVGAERIVTAVARLRALWSGEYLMLWRPPPVYSGLLGLGARGPEVAWLQGRLAELNGEPWSEVRDAVFDDGLHEQVMAFQESRGLTPDGLVGVRTLIHLNTATKAAGVPLLRPATP